MVTPVTDQKKIDELNANAVVVGGPSAVFTPKPADRPTPQTPEQALITAANARYAGVNPNLDAKSKYKSETSVKAYEASLPLFKAALQTGADKTGDNQLITYAAKMSDPTTGVLNGERENYAAATTAAERIQLYINNEIKPVFNDKGDVVGFKGLMSPNTRRLIRNELTNLMLARNEAYNLAREDWAATAKELNLNPKVVIGPHAGEKSREFFRNYDISTGVASPKVVAPAVGPETGGAKTYRFSPEREQELINYVSSDKFTPTGYADLVTRAAAEAGVNVDDKYRELSLAEGNRLFNAKKDGKPIAGAISYQKADETYQNQLDEYNKQRAKMEAESLGGAPSPYFERFAAGTGLADEASGLGAGIGAVLQGREFSPAYQLARDAATRRIQQLRGQQEGLAGFFGGAAELAGGVGTAVAPAAALARTRMLSQLSPTARLLLGETATGTALGAAEAAPGQRVRGAIIGGTTSPAFAATGALGQRITNRLVQGLPADVAPQSRMLLKEGIVPTPGQIGQETSGTFGRLVSTGEQAATSVPVLGQSIEQRRNEGILASNLAAAKKAVQPIGGADALTETGLALRDQLETLIGNAYSNALTPMRLVADKQFNAAKSKIQAKLSKIGPAASEPMKAVKDVWSSRVQPFIGANGEITGENLQAIKQGLATERALLKTKAGGKQATDIIDEFDKALFDGLAQRQAPELYQAYRNTDKAFRNSKIVTKAITAAERKPGAPGIFTPSELASQVIASEKKYGPSELGGAGGLSEAMTAVLPKTLPDTGTASRAAMLSMFGLGTGTVGGGLGLLAGNPIVGAGLGLGAAGLASLPYSRLGTKAIAKTLLGERPAAVTALSDYLARNPQLGRSVGMASGLDYITPDENFSNRPAMLTPEQQALINVYSGGR